MKSRVVMTRGLSSHPASHEANGRHHQHAGQRGDAADAVRHRAPTTRTALPISVASMVNWPASTLVTLELVM